MIDKSFFSKNISVGMMIIMFGVLPYSFGINITNAISLNLKETFNLDNLQIQYLSSIFIFFMGVSEAFFGIFTDTYGRKITIFYGFLLFSAGSFLISSSTIVEFLFAGRALQGVAAGMTYIATYTMVRDVMKLEQLGKAYGLITTGISIFAIIAIYIGAVIVDSHGYKQVFYPMSVVTIILATLTHIYIPETIRKKKKSLPSIPLFLDRCIKIIKTKNFFMGAMLCGNATAFMGMVPTILPPFLGELGIESDMKKIYFIIPSIVFLITSLIAANSVQKLGFAKLLKINIFVYILTLASAIYFRNNMGVWAIIIPLILASVSGAIVWNYAPAIAMEKLGHKAGVASSLFALIIFVSSSITATISIKLFKDNLQYAEVTLFSTYTLLFLIFGFKISQYLKRAI